MLAAARAIGQVRWFSDGDVRVSVEQRHMKTLNSIQYTVCFRFQATGSKTEHMLYSITVDNAFKRYGTADLIDLVLKFNKLLEFAATTELPVSCLDFRTMAESAWENDGNLD